MSVLKPIYESFIAGRCKNTTKNRPTFPNFYPGNNQIINEMVFADRDDLLEAHDSALKAFQTWSKWTINQRSNVLLKAAALLRERVQNLAELEVWDTGKPIAEALAVDVHSAADSLEYFAKIALGLEDQVMPHPKALIYTQREPLGVCVGIGAWNYPLQIACWKAGPALMMGNTMIFKPSEYTPMTAIALAEIFIEAGMPAGVFNVVIGDGAVAQALLSLPNIAKISFTGSVSTGKQILEQAAKNIIPVTLELGGKSPLIICEDANIDEAVIGCMLANFYTQGEICSNGTRVYVHESIVEELSSKLLAKVKRLVIGDPFNTNTQMGALISAAHLQKVHQFVKEAKAEGAELCYGGEMIHPDGLPGHFFEPTILTQCNDSMRIVQEEVFGPVLSILTFKEEEDVLLRANNSPYGLAAGVFTQDIKRGHHIAQRLEAGMCWINNYNVTPVSMPFGGRKLSGFGRENGQIALSQYSQQKSIYVELAEIEHSYS